LGRTDHHLMWTSDPAAYTPSSDGVTLPPAKCNGSAGFRPPSTAALKGSRRRTGTRSLSPIPDTDAVGWRHLARCQAIADTEPASATCRTMIPALRN
jgi:hypothetical protein